MNIIFDFLKNFIYEIIFTIVLSSGVIALHTTKINRIINLKAVGITHIHKKGRDVKRLMRSIEKASKICIIAFVPYSLVFDNRELLTEKIKEGCNIKILLCRYDSPVIKEVCQIENDTDYDIANKIEPLKNLLTRMKIDAGIESTGTIEVRTYNTEMRNPAIICYDKDDNKSAFLTVSLPPKRSIDSVMIEYKNNECNDVINYFNAIWNRHNNKNDIILQAK